MCATQTPPTEPVGGALFVPLSPRYRVTDKGATGWTLGVSRGDGSQPSRLPGIILEGGGAVLPCQFSTKNSSYRNELWAMVCALRSLGKVAIHLGMAGPVSHWTDNESICKFMQRRGTAPFRDWHARKSRDLWAEIRGRLSHWYALGGSWETSWVKGHVDSIASREEDSYTQAERMNMRADEIATAHLEGRGRGEEDQTLEVVDGAFHLAATTGGIWALPSRSMHCSDSTITHDDPTAEMPPRAAARALNLYWRERSERRVKKGVITEGLRAATPSPAMDERVLRSHSGGTTPNASDWPRIIFRSKLWWDHLPSQQVLNRGVPATQQPPELSTCELCGKMGEGSTWHLLASCKGATEIIQMRQAAHGHFSNLLVDLRPEYYGPRAALLSKWRGSVFRMVDDEWKPTRGWECRDGANAGLYENPWYGLFSPAWLDAWLECREEDPPSIQHYDAGVKLLRTLSEGAITMCSQVWDCIMKIRAQRRVANARSMEEEAKSLRLLEKREARETTSHANRLKTAMKIQIPLQRQETVTACHTLYRCVRNILARPPALRARKDLHLLDRWAYWSLGEVVEWTRSRRNTATRARRRLKRAMKGKARASVHLGRITDFFPSLVSGRGEAHGSTGPSVARRRELPIGSCDQFG